MDDRPLQVSDLEYELPPAMIATRPAEPRDAARMMVYRQHADQVEHRFVRDLPQVLEPDDCLVFNTTAVLPARWTGRRVDSGGRVHGLFLEEPHPGQWQVMLKSNGRLRAGQTICLHDREDNPSCYLFCLEQQEGRVWFGRLEGAEHAEEALDAVGRTPLPPYILGQRASADIGDELDRQWYQTVFADHHERHSVAAPTAGLHFTPQLLQALQERGIGRYSLTLHVGAGTFLPVTVESLEDHPMHRERFHVPMKTLQMLQGVRSTRPRVIAVGTTTVRALESLPQKVSGDGDYEAETDLMISPPFEFRHVEGMLTNFHLPRSTLLALVGARIGVRRVLELYRLAVESGYRFYSYGDAMLILP